MISTAPFPSSGLRRFASTVLGLLLLLLITRANAGPFISEFMADNQHTLADEDGQFPDWIEIQNPDLAAADLTGCFLPNNPQVLTKWSFPPLSLPANGRLVVFASGKNRISDPTHLHTSFQLSADGGFLALIRPDGVTIASAFTNYPALKTDVAYGIAQAQVTTSLLLNAAPQILVPTNASALPANWNDPAYVPDAFWTNGTAPPSVGFDTNQTTAPPANVAPSGQAVQSTTLSSFTANL